MAGVALVFAFSLGVAFDLAERGIKIKPYPCGGLTHAAIDALLHLRNQYGITPEIVELIRVNVTRRIFDKILGRLPESELEGKFSMPYLLARVLSDGKLAVLFGLHPGLRHAS